MYDVSICLSEKLLSIPEIVIPKNRKVGITMGNCLKSRFCSAFKRLQWISVMFVREICISTLVVLFSTGGIIQKYFPVRSNLHLIHFEYFQEKTLHVEGIK